MFLSNPKCRIYAARGVSQTPSILLKMRGGEKIMKYTIKDIKDFGAIDAENDVDLLMNFYKTDIIGQIEKGEKTIVIGRKGTGKSAIYTYICNEYKKESVKLVLNDYPWQLHDKFRNEVVSERECYVNSWMFLLYIEIAKKIVIDDESIWSSSEKREIKRLKRWLKRNWGSIDFDYKENLNPKESKTTFSFMPQIMGNGLGGIAKEISDNSSIGQSLSVYNQKLEKILSRLLGTYNKKIYLAFDQLDLAYSSDDKGYNNKLIGLLLATYQFYKKFVNVRVVLFLRSDIFNNITFQDKNKIKDNLVVFLDWDAGKEEGNLSLKQFIAIRIKNALKLSSDDFNSCWNAIFDNSKIGRNQFKWNHIAERTFLRPRDIIKFLNLAIDQANKRIECNPDSECLIINEDINGIKEKYSTYLFEELKDEISGKYTDYERYLEILREIHVLTFTKLDFQSKYDIINKRYPLKESCDTVLERLYEFSIIGFYKPGGGGYGGSEYRFQYTSDYQRFNQNASKYKVHLGYKEYLELIEQRNK